MEIRNLIEGGYPVSLAAAGHLHGAGGTRAASWQVPEELPVAMLLNGQNFAVMMATPVDLEDFGVGFAVTEGIVERPGQIESLRLGEVADGLAVNIVVASERAEAVAERRRTFAGRSGCGVCGAQTIAAALPVPKPVTSRPPPDIALLAQAYRELPARQPMKQANHSVHAAAFCRQDGVIALVREDIGRHNALDKLAGALLRAGEDGSTGFVLLSSRISVEMVQKAAAIGVPFLAAVSAPSALALRMAAEAGMVLAGLAKDDVMIFEPGEPGLVKGE